MTPADTPRGDTTPGDTTPGETTPGETTPGERTPRVTLGVPVYNGEQYLAETLDSLLAQDFSDFEIVISDNASTDRTQEICLRYAAEDPRVVYTRNDENIGGARNYTKLAWLARGEYFKWASADDLCAPGFVKECVEVLDEHPEVVLAYPGTMMLSDDGDELGLQPSGLHLPWRQPWKRMSAFALRRRFCNPCFGLMRTEMIRKTGLIRPYVSSDIAFLAEMALAGPIHEIPEVMFYRRITDTSCGLGSLTPKELSAWFKPEARTRAWFPMTRVFFEIERIIARSDLSVRDKLVTLPFFTAAWGKRVTRTRYFVARAQLRQLRARRRAAESGAEA